MIDHIKSSLTSMCVGISTFLLGLINSIFENLPFIHDIFGTISMGLGCVACMIIIVVNYRQAKINKLIIEEKEKNHG